MALSVISVNAKITIISIIFSPFFNYNSLGVCETPQPAEMRDIFLAK
jgi:hypothetical protein